MTISAPRAIGALARARGQQSACASDGEDDHECPAAICPVQGRAGSSHKGERGARCGEAPMPPLNSAARACGDAHATRLIGFATANFVARSVLSRSRPSSRRVQAAGVGLLPQTRKRTVPRTTRLPAYEERLRHRHRTRTAARTPVGSAPARVTWSVRIPFSVLQSMSSNSRRCGRFNPRR